MMLLPPPKGVCPICAVKHDDAFPHDATSMYYQYRFYGIRQRWPTWADAAAHCTVELRQNWRQALKESGIKWTVPADGSDPIADPPAESFHQVVGGIGTMTAVSLCEDVSAEEG